MTLVGLGAVVACAAALDRASGAVFARRPSDDWIDAPSPAALRTTAGPVADDAPGRRSSERSRSVAAAETVEDLAEAAETAAKVLPHIIVSVIDDMGWGDAPWNAHDAARDAMPFSHALRNESVSLAAYYAAKSCTPSRAMLLTGRHAATLGAYGVVSKWSAWGVSLDEALLPELLEAAAPGAYRAALVGKWDLGHAWRPFWPTRRGFASFGGLVSASLSDWSSHLIWSRPPLFDLQAGEAPDRDEAKADVYSTELFRRLARAEIAATRLRNATANASSSSAAGGGAPRREEREQRLYLHLGWNAIHSTPQLPPARRSSAGGDDGGDDEDEEDAPLAALMRAVVAEVCAVWRGSWRRRRRHRNGGPLRP